MSDITTPNSGDRSFDLSLRLLTILVVIALAGSVSLLAYRWLAPHLLQNNAGPVTTRMSQPQPAPTAADHGSARGDEVLMDPGRVFRCEEQGRVSFSDHACTGTPAGNETAAARPHAANPPAPPAGSR